MILVFPVACDCDIVDCMYVVGPESRYSCEKAAEVVLKLRLTPYFVMPTACRIPGTDVLLSGLMTNCLARIGVASVHTRVAKAWNTEGEVLAIIDYLRVSPFLIDEIVICCKWWHMPRTWALMKFHLWKAGMKIRVRTEWCRSDAKPAVILREFFGAWPLNIARIGRRRFRTGKWTP